MVRKIDDDLMRAVTRDDRMAVRDLIRSGADPNVISDSYHASRLYMDRDICRPLTSAATCGHLGNVIELLDAGADPSADKSVALLRAISGSHHNLVKELLARNANTQEYYVIEAVLGKPKPDHLMINLLINADMKPLDSDQRLRLDAFLGKVTGEYQNISKEAPSLGLILASSSGSPGSVQKLIEMGGDVNFWQGMALRCAIDQGHYTVVLQLLQLIDLNGLESEFLLKSAIDRSDSEIFGALWEACAPKNKDQQRLIARYASDNESEVIVAYLAQMGIRGGKGAKVIEGPFGKIKKR